MRIFAISPDVKRYKNLVDNEPESISNERFEQIMFAGTKSKIDTWTSLSLSWIIGADTQLVNKDTYDQDHAIPDIAYWSPGCLVLNPKSTEIIKPNLMNEAEFLPVTVEGEKGWMILNVVNSQDILDKANCRYRIRSNGKVGRMIKAAFFKDKITNGKLFKVAGRKIQIYTTDIQESFKEIVESHHLTGLKFFEY